MVELHEALIKLVSEGSVEQINTWALLIHDAAKSNDPSSTIQNLYNELVRLIDEQWSQLSLKQPQPTMQQVREAIERWDPGEITDEQKNHIGVVQSIILNTILDYTMMSALEFFGENATYFPAEDLKTLKQNRELQSALATLADYSRSKNADDARPFAENTSSIIAIAKRLFENSREAPEISLSPILLKWVEDGSGYDKFSRLLCAKKHKSFITQREDALINQLRQYCKAYKEHLETELTSYLKDKEPHFFWQIFEPKEENVVVKATDGFTRERRQIILGWPYLMDLDLLNPDDQYSSQGYDARMWLNIVKKKPDLKIALTKYRIVDKLAQLLSSPALSSAETGTLVPFFDLLEQSKKTLITHRNAFILLKLTTSKGEEFIQNITRLMNDELKLASSGNMSLVI